MRWLHTQQKRRLTDVEACHKLLSTCAKVLLQISFIKERVHDGALDRLADLLELVWDDPRAIPVLHRSVTA